MTPIEFMCAIIWDDGETREAILSNRRERVRAALRALAQMEPTQKMRVASMKKVSICDEWDDVGAIATAGIDAARAYILRAASEGEGQEGAEG
jgi:hypothetical protein